MTEKRAESTDWIQHVLDTVPGEENAKIALSIFISAYLIISGRSAIIGRICVNLLVFTQGKISACKVFGMCNSYHFHEVLGSSERWMQSAASQWKL